MFKKIAFLLILIVGIISNAQVVINEIDADNPGSDNKEFVELKSNTPNFSLNGYVLVFFNGQTGSGVLSYYALDLDGYTTDANGIIHFGNSQVSPTPKLPYYPLNTIQNGPDIIALFVGNDTDYPIDSIANNTNLIDAVAYSTSSTAPSSLMTIFGITYFYIDNQPLSSTSNSIQRKDDGTYEVKTPTPGVNNDGSGIVIIYLTTTTNLTTVTEGETLDITFTTSQTVQDVPLNISFSLNNNTFNTTDYIGMTNVTIPVGANSTSASIQLLNDGINEGDEEIKIEIATLPTQYSLNNNAIIIRVNDINFAVLPFGKPSTPTYGTVTSTAPIGYYSSLEGLSGAALKQATQDIIANPAVVRVHNYDDVWDILKTSDQNPENSNQVWLIYTEAPRSKLDLQSGNSIIGKWNREHIYCQSRGGYSAGTDYITPFADGINTWAATTGANDIGAGVSDAHHIRAVDGQENSSRNNRNYGSDYNGPSGSTSNAWKGDVARACFYMAIRYNGLNVLNGNPIDGTIGQIGDLATLLSWNNLDPSDDFEMNRNNYIYTWQVNRNPFIDYPLLADYIWGTHAGEVWHASLNNNSFSNSSVLIYPNPAKTSFAVSGINSESTITLYSLVGTKIFERTATETASFDVSDLSKGIYLVKITSEGKTTEKKIIIE